MKKLTEFLTIFACCFMVVYSACLLINIEDNINLRRANIEKQNK